MTREASHVMRFIGFLAHRTRCENMELLVRITTEYFSEPPCFSTVETMVRWSFPTITVLPDSNSDFASGQQTAPHRFDGNYNELAELHRALQRKVVLYNWDWLLAMYADFCEGHDSTLQEFVRLGREATSVIPAPPYPSAPRSLQIQGQRVTQRAQTSNENSSYSAQTQEPASRKKSKNATGALASRSHHLVTITEDVQRVLDAINTQHSAIEREKPWEEIFDVSKTQFPFDAAKHPTIARAFRLFWKRHAQAVWERNFWCRLQQLPTTIEHVERRNRQRNAASSFECTVMLPLFNELGAEFFVDLDERSELHNWWWYRGPLVDLMCIQSAHGLEACLEYQQSQATARFPKVPAHAQFRPYLHKEDHGSSMWSMMSASKHIAATVKALKRGRSALKSERG